jgi:hypothetical protein
MNTVIRELKNEYTMMPEYHLKAVAIESYGMTRKEISQLDKNALIDNMLAIEFKNSYK